MTVEKGVTVCSHRTLSGPCDNPRCACVSGHRWPCHDPMGRVIPAADTYVAGAIQRLAPERPTPYDADDEAEFLGITFPPGGPDA